MTAFIRRLLRDRRAATAVALAILTVPLLLTAGVAVDLSRVASARALLQASTDAAAIAGAGAWQTSQSYAYASSVTSAAYSGTASQLSNFVATSAPTPELTCTGTTTQCGGTASSSTYVTTTATYGCPSSAEYCVVVVATGVLKNSLLGGVIPSETLTTRSMATTAFPPTTISGKNIPPSPGFGSAGDVSGIYAYAVPMSGTGSNATPQYNQLPQPNSSCSNYSSIGPLALAQLGTAASTTCNYLFIALSTSSGTAGTGGSITLQQNQPIAFTFVNYTGANPTNPYQQLDGTNHTTNLMISVNGNPATFQQNGNVTVYTSQTTTVTCDSNSSTSHYTTSGSQPYQCNSNHIQSTDVGNSSTSSSGTVGTTSSCTSSFTKNNKKYCYIDATTTVTSGTMTLSAQCPAETLYGSLSTGYGAPVSDSWNEYSSAYEVLGEPPTYETNHALTPFVTNASAATTANLDDGTTYTVNAVCPNYSTSGTSINAPISSSYALSTGFTGVNIFSTAFPGQTYTDSTLAPSEDSSGNAMTTGSGDIFPPAIAGCTPATPTSDGNVTTTSTWWNWNSSNSGSCGYESSANRSSYLSSGQPTYSNCTLLIQPLGTAVPVNSNNQALLPDYYLLVKNSSGTIVGLDPIWNGQTFTDLMPGIITNQLGGNDSNVTVNANGTITDSDNAATYSTSSGKISGYGYVPSSTSHYNLSFATATDGLPAGNYTVWIEPPASTSTTHSSASYTEFHLPPNTSSQCYNPQANGNAAGYTTIQEGGGTSMTFGATGDNNHGTAIDPVANPQLGAILCNSNPPETYALYWNDLGTYGSDDLGYWNAVVAFTCSVPGSGTTGGGPATLSG